MNQSLVDYLGVAAYIAAKSEEINEIRRRQRTYQTKDIQRKSSTPAGKAKRKRRKAVEFSRKKNR